MNTTIGQVLTILGGLWLAILVFQFVRGFLAATLRDLTIRRRAKLLVLGQVADPVSCYFFETDEGGLKATITGKLGSCDVELDRAGQAALASLMFNQVIQWRAIRTPAGEWAIVADQRNGSALTIAIDAISLRAMAREVLLDNIDSDDPTIERKRVLN